VGRRRICERKEIQTRVIEGEGEGETNTTIEEEGEEEEAENDNNEEETEHSDLRTHPPTEVEMKQKSMHGKKNVWTGVAYLLYSTPCVSLAWSERTRVRHPFLSF